MTVRKLMLIALLAATSVQAQVRPTTKAVTVNPTNFNLLFPTAEQFGRSNGFLRFISSDGTVSIARSGTTARLHVDIPDVSEFLTQEGADLLYQPIGGEGGFLTRDTADGLYQPLGDYALASSLLDYLTADAAALAYVPAGRTITVNGVSYDLSADRSWDTGNGFPLTENVSGAGKTLSDLGGLQATNAYISNLTARTTYVQVGGSIDATSGVYVYLPTNTTINGSPVLTNEAAFVAWLGSAGAGSTNVVLADGSLLDVSTLFAGLITQETVDDSIDQALLPFTLGSVTCVNIVVTAENSTVSLSTSNRAYRVRVVPPGTITNWAVTGVSTASLDWCGVVLEPGPATDFSWKGLRTNVPLPAAYSTNVYFPWRGPGSDYWTVD